MFTTLWGCSDGQSRQTTRIHSTFVVLSGRQKKKENQDKSSEMIIAERPIFQKLSGGGEGRG